MRVEALRKLAPWILAGALLGCAAEDPIPRVEDLRLPDSDVLIDALATGDAERAARAALAMGRIQHPSYAEPLARASRADRPAAVRKAALFALGQLGLAEGVEPPEVALEACRVESRDPDPAIAALAVEALGKLAAPQTVDEVVSLLEHPDARVRAEAALALFRFSFAPVWRREAESPPPLPAPALEALRNAFGDPRAEVRRAACYRFSRYPEPRLAPDLARLASDPDEWVRLFSIRALGRAGGAEEQSIDPAVIEAVAGALDDASPRVRTEAVAAVAAMGAIDRLSPRLAEDDSLHVRAALARALGDAADAASLGRLRALERDAAPTVRAAAIDSLAKRMGAAYVDALSEHLASAVWTDRVAAATAAAELGEAGRPLIERAFADQDHRVRVAALDALDGPEGADALLRAALAADDLALRGTAVARLGEWELPERLAWLEQAYDGSPGSDWVEVREEIVDALAAIDGAEDLLRRAATEDEAASVRAKAATALARRGLAAPETAQAPIEPSALLGARFAEDPVVVLETTKGEIEIRCLASEAPVHVAGFVQRVREGFYDGLIWHRVVSDFVIQGGDPRRDGWGSAGWVVRDEIHRGRYERGTVGMPKAGKDTGGCQLFITHVPTPHLDGNYTVFGRVERGLDVVDAIEVGDGIVRARVR